MKKISLLVSILLISNLYADDFDDDFDSEFGNTKKVDVNKSTDDFDDAFSDFDSKKKKKTYVLTFSGSLKVRGYGFIKDTDYANKDNNRFQSDNLLELNSKFKKDKYSVFGSIFGLVGTEYNTYDYNQVFKEPRDLGKKVPIAGLKELYIIRSSDNYDLILGKRIFKTGISTLYSPSDVYNIKLSPDPMDPYTIGTWLGDFEYYKDSASYGIVFFPYISDSKTFSDKSRWSGNSDKDNQNLNSFIIPENANIIQDKTNKVRVLAKYKNTIEILTRGVDIMCNVGYGPSLYTILQKTDKENTYLETRPEVWYISTGFSTTYKKLEVHAEAYYQYVFSGKDDDFVSAVGGATYTLDKFVDKVGFDKIDMTVEYVREIVTKTYDNEDTYRSSQKERAPKNDILINVNAEINDKWSLIYFGNFRLSINQNKDAGRYQKIGTNYKIKDGLVAGLYGEMFNGQANSYYGRWKDNDRVIMQLKYSF